MVNNGPSFSLVTVGKVDMFAFCLTNCVVLSGLNATEAFSFSYSLAQSLEISKAQVFSETREL